MTDLLTDKQINTGQNINGFGEDKDDKFITTPVIPFTNNV